MESTRQLKYGRLIQKELGEIFQRDAKHLFEGAFITLTKVTVSPDLGLAKVYLSFMLVKNKQEMLKLVNSHAKAIKKLLGDRIRKQARVIPDLKFYLDDNLDYAARMDEIFSKLDIPPGKEKDNDEEE